jgi:hypothetical protein
VGKAFFRLKSENLRGSPECLEYHQRRDAHPLWWWRMRVHPESLLEHHTGLLGTLGNHRRSADGVAAGRASVVPTSPTTYKQPHHNNQPTTTTQLHHKSLAPSRHTNPNQGSASRADEGATSRRLGPDQQTEVMLGAVLFIQPNHLKLRIVKNSLPSYAKEIQTLKQEAKGRKDKGQIPAKERPTKKTHASQREEAQNAPLCLTIHNMKISLKPLAPSRNQDHQHHQRSPEIVEYQENPSRSRPPPYGGKSSPTKKHSVKKNCSSRKEGRMLSGRLLI